ncbi:MAG: hypothetical protein WCG45_06175 [bacterium]
MFSVTIKGLESIALMTTQEGVKKLVSSFSVLTAENENKILNNTLEFKNEFISIYPIDAKIQEEEINDEFGKVFEKIKQNREETPEEKKIRLRKELEEKIKNSISEENKKKEAEAIKKRELEQKNKEIEENKKLQAEQRKREIEAKIQNDANLLRQNMVMADIVQQEEKAKRGRKKKEEVENIDQEINLPVEKAKREKKLFNEMISRRIKEQLANNLELKKALKN